MGVGKRVRTSVVTGSNRGIGKETAQGLARAGHRVVLACRNMGEAEKAAQEIRLGSGNPEVFARKLDLASLDSIREFARDFERD